MRTGLRNDETIPMPNDDELAVLYVDDDVVNLRVFEANFGKELRVLTCASGEQALELVRAGKHELAVLLADERMPGMTGSELLEQVAVLSPYTHRMVVTAYADMDSVMRAVNRVKVSRYYYKPWVKEELQQALEDAIEIYRLHKRLREQEQPPSTSASEARGASAEPDAASARLAQALVEARRGAEVLGRDLAALAEKLSALGEAGSVAEVVRLVAAMRETTRQLRAALGAGSETGKPRGERRPL
jgi:response regulator RpfG family c-di-GMP phosphodiesterase